MDRKILIYIMENLFSFERTPYLAVLLMVLMAFILMIICFINAYKSSKEEKDGRNQN